MPTVTRGQAAAEGNVPSSSSLDDSCPEFLQPFNLDREIIRALLNLGVRSTEDLLLVRETDLSSVASTIMARRLVNQFQGCVSSSAESPCLDTSRSSWLSVLPRWKETSTPLSHLQMFESTMLAAEVPVMRWPRAFSTTLPYFKQVFINSLLPLQWDLLKEAFLERYHDPRDEANSLRDLLNLKMQPNESPHDYGDRVLDLCRRAGRRDSDPVVLSAFEQGIALRFKSFYALSPSPQDLKTAVSLLVSVCRACPDASNQKSKFCRYCKNSGHTLKECRKLSNSRNRQGQSTSSPSSQPTQQQSPFKPKPREVKCFKCGRTGHYANKCPSSNSGLSHHSNGVKIQSSAASSGATFLSSQPSVNMITTEESLAADCRNPPSSSPVDVFREYYEACEDLEANSLSHSQSMGDLLYLKLLVGKNKTPVTALLDSGASHSILSTQLAEDLGISELDEKPILLNVANGEACKAYSISQPIKVQYGPNITVFHSFFVMQTKFQCIVGLDLFAGLKITVSGLRLSPDENSLELENGSEGVADSHSPVEKLHPCAEQIEKAIRPLLSENLSTQSEFCSFGPSMVYLPTSGEPVFRRQYPIPYSLRPLVSQQIQSWLKSGVIVKAPIDTPWNSPILAVVKDGKHRIVLDPRGLNKILKYHNSVIPRIADILDESLGFAIVSSLDLTKSYHQFMIAPQDREKTTFTWQGVKYMFVGAPFGLSNLTPHFQRSMQAMLADFHEFASPYVDDIIVRSGDVQEHIAHLQAVIQRLTGHKLTLNQDKCKFGYTQLKILGHVISGDSLRIDPKKVSAFARLSFPNSGKQMQSLLGAASFLRRFIPLYAKVCAPLEKLRFQEKIINPPADAIRSFKNLKKLLSCAPVLSRPDFSLPFRVGTDASQMAVGAVLFQIEEDTTIKYNCFEAKALTKTQRNYPSYKRELLAIVFALDKFRQWIFGRKFFLYTDHQSLSYLFTASKFSYVINYWFLKLFEFDFDIIHIKGLSNILPDALSRLCYSEGESGGSVSAAIAMDDSNTPSSSSLKAFIKERFGRSLPPADTRRSLIRKAHQDGHSGTEKIFLRLFHDGYYWPTMRKDIAQQLQSCDTCNKYNLQRIGFHPLQTQSASLPFDLVHIDLFGPLVVSSNGNKFVLLVIDSLSRFVVLRPLRDKSALTVAQALYSCFVDFGFPKALVSDNGTEFVNQVVQALVNFFKVKHVTITPYNPRSNGAAERHVQESKKVLAKILDGELADWDVFLSSAEHFLNIRVVARTKSSPFALMFGRAPNDLIDYSDVQTSLISIDALLQRQRELMNVVYPAIGKQVEQYQHNVAKVHDKSKKIVHFEVGDIVYRRLDVRQPLGPRYEGPFEVVKVLRNGYKIKSELGDVYFAPPNKLKRSLQCQGSSSTSSSSSSDPNFSDQVYEFDKILSHRKSLNGYEYLVKWKGYAQPTWEPPSNFSDPSALSKYWKRVRKGSRQV